MKILYLCPDLGIPVLGRKGASTHVRELVTALVRTGHSVVAAAPLLNKSPWEKPAPLGTSLLHVPLAEAGDAVVLGLKAFNELLGVDNTLPGELRRILYNEDLFRHLKRRFESDPPDFIYERASLYGTAGVLLAEALEVPLLLEINAPLTMEQSAYRGTGLEKLAAQAEQWTLLRADAVLAVSALLGEHVLSLGVEAERVHVIPNGVDVERFQPGPLDPRVRSRWQLDGGPVLGFIGGLRPWHGVEMLPDLLHRLIPRHPGLRLMLVGEGPLRAQLQRDLEQRGLERNAVFTGALSHEAMPELIRQFDISLAPYPSPDHPFYFSPLKLFEYMACGSAVVAAGLGQIAEVVRDGETGLLYPPGDLEALTARCERLLADPSLRRRLGRAAAEHIHEHYTWDHNARRVAEVAADAIAKRRSGT